MTREEAEKFLDKKCVIDWKGDKGFTESMVGTVIEITKDNWIVVDWGMGVNLSAVFSIKETNDSK